MKRATPKENFSTKIHNNKIKKKVFALKKVTGYDIYNKAAKARTKQNTLEELYPPLPNKKFDIIYADPPWDYGGKMQFDRSSTSKENLDLSKNIFISSASFVDVLIGLSSDITLLALGAGGGIKPENYFAYLQH